MVGGNRTAMVIISHEGLDRREVLDVLRRRWPTVVVKSVELEEPALAMSSQDAADLGRCPRGVEPLRIVIMPPKISRRTIATVTEPMPVVV